MTQTSSDVLASSFQTLEPMMVMFFIFGIVAFAVSIAYVIRLWLVQTATFQIQEDLREIRNHLIGAENDELRIQTSKLESHVSDEEKKAILAEDIAKLRPRRVFVWLAIAIPILLIVLLIVLNKN